MTDDPTMTMVVTNPALPPETKKAVVEAKLQTLDRAGQLPAELTNGMMSEFDEFDELTN